MDCVARFEIAGLRISPTDRVGLRKGFPFGITRHLRDADGKAGRPGCAMHFGDHVALDAIHTVQPVLIEPDQTSQGMRLDVVGERDIELAAAARQSMIDD